MELIISIHLYLKGLGAGGVSSWHTRGEEVVLVLEQEPEVELELESGSESGSDQN